MIYTPWLKHNGYTYNLQNRLWLCIGELAPWLGMTEKELHEYPEVRMCFDIKEDGEWETIACLDLKYEDEIAFIYVPLAEFIGKNIPKDARFDIYVESKKEHRASTTAE